MIAKWFIRNIPYEASEADLRAHLRRWGKPSTCKIVTDYDTGASRGFAFVEINTDDDRFADAEAAMIDCFGEPMSVTLPTGKVKSRALHIEKQRDMPPGQRHPVQRAA